MGIPVACECGSSIRVKDELAGKRVRCPQCGTALQVGQPEGAVKHAGSSKAAATAVKSDLAKARRSAAAAPLIKSAQPARAGANGQPAKAAADEHRAERQKILAALDGHIEPVPVSSTYLLGLLLSAVVLVLVTTAYVGLIGAIGWATYYFGAKNVELLYSGNLISVVTYLLPLLFLVTLVLFMFKPLLSPGGARVERRRLKREDEPFLFEFVERLSEMVGAPQPREIIVDCDVNASAGFRRGVFSMLGGDMTLTIGMPLVAGLHISQLAGVLAHEFGHFAQGVGLRLMYFVRTLNYWLLRCVYGRDRWDERVWFMCQTWPPALAWIWYVVRFFVAITRGILWVLLKVGAATAGVMLRQMEYDADLYEIRLAGSDTFATTSRQIRLLTVAHRGAHIDTGYFMREGRLADNLPRLVYANYKNLKPETKKKIDEEFANQPTSIVDTHPTDKDRVAQAEAEQAPGLFRLTNPATLLFRDFDGLSRAVTLDMYKGIFGKTFSRDVIRPVDDLIARATAENESIDSLARYLQNAFSVLRPLPLDNKTLDAPADFDKAAARLRKLRQAWLETVPQYRKNLERFAKAFTQMKAGRVAVVATRAGFRAKDEDTGALITTPEAARVVQGKGNTQMHRLGEQMSAPEQLAADRLMLGLQILQSPQLAEKVPAAKKWRVECRQSYPTLCVLMDQLPVVHELRCAQESLARVVGHLSGNTEKLMLIEQVREQMNEVYSRIQDVQLPLSGELYPFDHARADTTIADYVLPKWPDEANPVELYQAAEAVTEGVPLVAARLLGKLCDMAENVETALGLDPLQEAGEVAGV